MEHSDYYRPRREMSDSSSKRKKKRLRDHEEEEKSEMNEIIFIPSDDEGNQPLTRSQRKELKRQQNREWKWHRVDSDPNPRHTEYYRQQLPDLYNEWASFQETMAKVLPVTFRLCCARNEFICSILKLRLSAEFRHMRGRFTAVNDIVVDEVVVPVSWCPNSWQINCDSATLAKDEAFSPLYSLLLREVKLCHVVRQELVSMIPVILLDPQSFHFVLDMCAAPGSKTEQIISKVCNNISSTGLVVANDADPRRLATLRKRYESCRYPNLVFTCAKADYLLNFIKTKISFERILCDVPCTGDGTFRKSPHLWRLFRPRFAVELHPLQLDIARCGVNLMRKSFLEGKNCRMVYSTCSLNPIENEAVIAALLMEFWDQGLNLQLLDPSSMLSSDNTSLLLARDLPGIRWRSGVSSWLADVDIMLAGESEPNDREKSRSRLPSLSRSMNCPQSKALLNELKLERCMRIFPQDMNTGGFFIAVLEISALEVSQIQREALRMEAELVNNGGHLDIPVTDEIKPKKKPASNRNSLTAEKKMRSIKVFQELGYNPHTAPETDQTNQKTTTDSSWKEISEAFTYSRLSSTEMSSIVEAIGCLPPSTPSLTLFLEVALCSKQGEQQSVRKHQPRMPDSSHHISILSPSAVRFLEVTSSANIVTQAGVRVLDISSTTSGKSSVILNEFGGEIGLRLLQGRSLHLGVSSFQSILMKEIANSRGEMTSQLSGEDQLKIQALPLNSYALMTTTFSFSSSKKLARNPTEKKRISKAERKRMKNGIIGNMSEGSTDLEATTSPTSFVLSLVVQKEKNDRDEETLRIHAPRELIQSYLDCLLFSN